MPSWFVYDFKNSTGADTIHTVLNIKTGEKRSMRRSAIIKSILQKKMNFINVKVPSDNSRLIERTITQDSERYRVITSEVSEMINHLKKVLPTIECSISDKKYRGNDIINSKALFEKIIETSYSGKSATASVLLNIENNYRWTLSFNGSTFLSDKTFSKIEDVVKELHKHIVILYVAYGKELTPFGAYFLSNYHREIPLEELKVRKNLYTAFKKLTKNDLDCKHIYKNVKYIYETGKSESAIKKNSPNIVDITSIASHLLNVYNGTETNFITLATDQVQNLVASGINAIADKVKQEAKEVTVETSHTKHGEDKGGFDYVLTFGYKEKEKLEVHFDYRADENMLYVRSESPTYGVLDERSVDIKALIKTAFVFIKNAILLLIA